MSGVVLPDVSRLAWPDGAPPALEALGLLATALILSGFFLRAPRATLRMGVAGLALWLVYFAQIGAWAAFGGTLLALVRSLAGIFLPDSQLRLTMAALVPVLATTALLTDEGWIAAFAFAASTLKVLAVLARDRVIVFRGMFLAGELMTLPYALAAGGLAFLASTLISLAVMAATLLWIARTSAPPTPSPTR